ncbi:MAG: sugar kinase [Candidatus Binatus sp.]|uniref:carbohydrate kinase family protein n=1 Tax=Candidatus Binatus sp. TaxID=2811406 RepID=UPI003BB08430
MSGTVVTLGAHVLDILGRYVTHIPERQGSVLLDEIRLAPAGSAAGTAVGLAKLGLEVATVGAVGDDALGDVLIRALNGFGVDTAHVVRKPGVQTSASILPIRPNGDRPALHAIGANAVYSIDDVPWTLLETAAHLHLGGNDSMRGLGRDGTAQILRRARDGGATTSMDILSEGSPKLLAILKPCLPLVDWFMPNADQACRLTDSHTLEEAASRLLDLGVGGVVLTMGGDGSLLATAHERAHLAAHEIAVVDTSGCGDAYCAGFIRALRLGWPPSECMKLGNAAAALVAQGLGSDAGIRDLDDTVRFMRETPLRSSKPSCRN